MASNLDQNIKDHDFLELNGGLDEYLFPIPMPDFSQMPPVLKEKVRTICSANELLDRNSPATIKKLTEGLFSILSSSFDEIKARLCEVVKGAMFLSLDLEKVPTLEEINRKTDGKIPLIEVLKEQLQPILVNIKYLNIADFQYLADRWQTIVVCLTLLEQIPSLPGSIRTDLHTILNLSPLPPELPIGRAATTAYRSVSDARQEQATAAYVPARPLGPLSREVAISAPPASLASLSAGTTPPPVAASIPLQLITKRRAPTYTFIGGLVVSAFVIGSFASKRFTNRQNHQSSHAVSALPVVHHVTTASAQIQDLSPLIISSTDAGVSDVREREVTNEVHHPIIPFTPGVEATVATGIRRALIEEHAQLISCLPQNNLIRADFGYFIDGVTHVANSTPGVRQWHVILAPSAYTMTVHTDDCKHFTFAFYNHEVQVGSAVSVDTGMEPNALINMRRIGWPRSTPLPVSMTFNFAQ